MQITNIHLKTAPINHLCRVVSKPNYCSTSKTQGHERSTARVIRGLVAMSSLTTYNRAHLKKGLANYEKRLQSIVPVTEVPQSWNNVPIKAISTSPTTLITAPNDEGIYYALLLIQALVNKRSYHP